MREARIICDGCGKNEKDAYGLGSLNRGWISLSRDLGVNMEGADFCSTACALEWLKAPAGERKAKAEEAR